MSKLDDSTKEVINRLEILWKKLEDEGLYVSANTVTLAIIELKKLSGVKYDCL